MSQLSPDLGVDWSAPWLAGVAELGRQISGATDWLTELNRQAIGTGLLNHLHHPVRFVGQDQLPSGTAYEAFIHATGKVPTRDNLHDLFNALVWLTWPYTKATLNHLQATQIASQGIGTSRGPTRDAVTLFDENAAILAVTDNTAGDALIESLFRHQWQQLFIDRRTEFDQLATVALFGHAIMEKLVNPYKAITAHTLVCRVAPIWHTRPAAEQRAWLDGHVAAQVAQQGLQPGMFTPLPVLGIPGWWPEQDIAFYADTQVFRPERTRR